MIKILIADDHPVVRAGLREIVATEPSLALVGEAANGDETVAKVQATEPDVLLLDITMPGAPFLELLRRLRARHPRLRVLVLSVHPEDQYALRALRAGAAGYLTKERSPEELVGAIKQVAAGGRYFTPSVAERLVSLLERGPGAAPHETLSGREHQVLCLMGSGKTIKQIAGQFSVSPKTVSTYRARILRKMKLSTNADLIRYALQRELA